MTAVLILLASGDCVANMEINKFEEEINAYYIKIFTPVWRQAQVGCIVVLAICC
jgi:hypothetical protein